MSLNQDKSKLSEVEHIKEKSKYLEGTLQDSLRDEVTGNLYAQDQQLIKFHGSYVQYDREVEKEELMKVFKTVLKQKTQEKEKDMTDRRVIERLEELKGLLDKKLITQEEYDRKREAIIEEL